MTDPAYWGERAKDLARGGHYAEAEAVLRAGLTVHPGHSILSYALGILLLARGAEDEGWWLYEHRRVMPSGPRTPQFSFPEWRGEPVATLLVLPEQGLGDQIMFARFIPPLVARGIRVTLLAPPLLVPLFAGLGAEVRPVDGAVAVTPCDAWCFIGSLPRWIVPRPSAPYLPGGGPGAGIGLMLRGNPNYAGDRVRSLPEATAQDLLRLGRSLHPDHTGARDFQATAEIIAGLALVVAVDTAVAHLAGAMGKPTWVLLPHESDWRWGRTRRDSTLYPSARLFRQPAPGDWDSVVAEVRREVAASQVRT